MLSILIPIYNYNAFPLVQELHKQCVKCNIDFEILCQDDCSSEYVNENQTINTLEKCTFSRNKTNLGRGHNINTLANQAAKDYLLLVDCDTFPKNRLYIQNYVDCIQKGNATVLYGGIIYESQKPSTEKLLRWVYGNKREALSIELRIKNPNRNALTSNLVIKKEIFTKHPFDSTITKYGYEDLCFLVELESNGFVVNHIENPTYHLNLESSELFLKKTKTALENLAFIFETKKRITTESKIITAYTLLKKIGISRLVARTFKKGENVLKNNLISKKPSLFVFDLYKLGYFCQLQNKKSILTR
ncbi:glycosyltransferase involved in cell wall biosynthesis [Flavobacterium sp. 28A]|uniref:glycosyltransferase family 2 protein n=1 Tax=Flavobacterium sp. 28A TaxID=2735895 RepID=UPI00156E9DC9|nr:glycosyltransferase [Flavobacterium sp. 28A]NRT17056.1 glycosyltransferase involved in cell wall biosynthesis [Flavobacterium sp. 28A]